MGTSKTIVLFTLLLQLVVPTAATVYHAVPAEWTPARIALGVVGTLISCFCLSCCCYGSSHFYFHYCQEPYEDIILGPPVAPPTYYRYWAPSGRCARVAFFLVEIFAFVPPFVRRFFYSGVKEFNFILNLQKAVLKVWTVRTFSVLYLSSSWAVTVGLVIAVRMHFEKRY